jgi:5-methylcytosine-specific restriction endonuclease McrA
MRAPCRFGCGTAEGFIRTIGGQDVVRCSRCGRPQYNAPRVETGRAERTVASVRNGISPQQRARILTRDGGRCVLCGSRGDEAGLQLGHLVPVARGLAYGLTERELNDDENLAAMCADCNLGLGEDPPPLWITVPLLRLRLRRR